MPGSRDQEGKLGHAQLVAAFEALSNRLAERGVRAHLYIIGGAAMVFSHRRSRTTVDVDALTIDPREAVLDAAADVARERNLKPDWLNDDWRWVVGGLPRLQPDTAAEVVFETPHLVVTGASARHMLALKLRAGRGADMEDIQTLLRTLAVKSVDEARQIHGSVFLHDDIEPRMAVRIEEMLAKHRGEARNKQGLRP